MLQIVPFITKKCVCDLCIQKQQSRVPCHVCQNVVRQLEATGIKDMKLKQQLLSFLADANRYITTDAMIGRVRAYSDVDITKRIERRLKYEQSLQKPKSGSVLDSIVRYVSDVSDIDLVDATQTKRRVTIQIPERIISMEDIYGKNKMVFKDEKEKVPSKPIIKPSLETKASQQVVQSSDRVKKMPYLSGDVAERYHSDTILGIGTTGVIRRYHSEESLITSFSKITDEIFKRNFKYFFPRPLKKEKKPVKTSAELIKDTAERLAAETAEKIRKQEEIKRINIEKGQMRKKATELEGKSELVKLDSLTSDDAIYIKSKTDKNIKIYKKAPKGKGWKDKDDETKRDGVVRNEKGKRINKEKGIKIEKSQIRKKAREVVGKAELAKLKSLISDDTIDNKTGKKIKWKRTKDQGDNEKIERDGVFRKEKGKEITKERGERKAEEKRAGIGKEHGAGREKNKGVEKKTEKEEIGKKKEKQSRLEDMSISQPRKKKKQEVMGKENLLKEKQSKLETILSGPPRLKKTQEVMGKENSLKEKQSKSETLLSSPSRVKKSQVMGKENVLKEKQSKLDTILSGPPRVKKTQEEALNEIRNKLGKKKENILKEKQSKLEAIFIGLPHAKKTREVAVGRTNGLFTIGDELEDNNEEETNEKLNNDELFELKKERDKPIKYKIKKKGKTVASAAGKPLQRVSNEITEDELYLLDKVLKKHDKIKKEGLEQRKLRYLKLTKQQQMADKKAQNVLDDLFDEHITTIDVKLPQKDNQAGTPAAKKTVDAKHIQLQASGDNLIIRLIKQKQTEQQKHELVPEHYIPDLPLIKRITKPAATQYAVDESEDSLADEQEVKKQQILEELVYGNTIIRKIDLPPPPEPQIQPELFESIFNEEKASALKPVEKPAAIEIPVPTGTFRYALSDRKFIENGWTLLPVEKIIRKMNIYRMHPAQPEFDWFANNKGKGLMFYDTGEKLAEFTDDGHGRWYYKNGRLALDYYDSEEINAQQRFVIYSSGENDERGRSCPITVLGMFDYMGNGVVLDHHSKIRLKYNQSEGVLLDRSIGPVSHWKWHSLNDPPELQQVMIDTQLPFKYPELIGLGEGKERPNNMEMLAIEFDNCIKSRNSKPAQKFKPYQVKMKALKINEQFSLRIIDQKKIYLIFREGSTNMKLNLGMAIDHNEIMDTDTSELNEVTLSMEKSPAVTDSIENIHKKLHKAQRINQVHTERERWKKSLQLEHDIRAEKLAATTSKPLRTPMLPAHSTSAHNYQYSANSLYYNTRLF